MTQNNVKPSTRKELTQTRSKEATVNEPDFREQSRNEGGESLYTEGVEKKKKKKAHFSWNRKINS